MRALVVALLLWPTLAHGQSRTVLPSELSLSVSVDEMATDPFTREMVLLTIKGIYRRHITRESLVQPDFEGFSWAQLGGDSWADERLNGQKVKTFTRRMAIYPDRAGTLTIGPFVHKLTLTDEGDDWFEHKIQSDPITIDVQPAPKTDDWWFPVRVLKVSDQWSNAPDQLAPGEGVLRVVRIEALGVTPEMIPPMPTLRSPSGMIFPHPDKRFVELTPAGPMSYAFWRWTIQPSNDTSTIVEPLSFTYFDTTSRVAREVTISAQRVAYGTVTGDTVTPTFTASNAAAARLPGWPLAGLAGLVFVIGTGAGLWGRTITGLSALHRFSYFDPMARRLRRAARAGQIRETRRAAVALLRRDGPSQIRQAMIDDLDRACFSRNSAQFDLKRMVRAFLGVRARSQG